jgi:hypothetical protein
MAFSGRRFQSAAEKKTILEPTDRSEQAQERTFRVDGVSPPVDIEATFWKLRQCLMDVCQEEQNGNAHLT